MNNILHSRPIQCYYENKCQQQCGQQQHTSCRFRFEIHRFSFISASIRYSTFFHRQSSAPLCGCAERISLLVKPVLAVATTKRTNTTHEAKRKPETKTDAFAKAHVPDPTQCVPHNTPQGRGTAPPSVRRSSSTENVCATRVSLPVCSVWACVLLLSSGWGGKWGILSGRVFFCLVGWGTYTGCREYSGRPNLIIVCCI